MAATPMTPTDPLEAARVICGLWFDEVVRADASPEFTTAMLALRHALAPPRPAGVDVERLATDKAFEELHQRGFLLVPSGYSCSLISDAFIEAYHRLAALTGTEEPARE